MAEKHPFPWEPGTATGIGSMPGENPMEAARIVAGELPELPYLAELPGRGPGADLTGRAAALLVELPVEVTPRGWRIAERPGRDLRRARSLLSSDLDAMEEVLEGYAGPLKVQLAGPWTLAATIEQPRSLSPALADPGLVADLTASLAEGAAAHVAELAKRVPRATLLVQLDEPLLPAVANGEVPTPSGLSRVRAVDEEFLRDRLRQVITAVGGYTIVHCCARGYPFATVTGSGADAISFDLSLLAPADYDRLAETAEAGAGLFVGAISGNDPFLASGVLAGGDAGALRRAAARAGGARGGSDEGTERGVPTPATTARSVQEVWRRLALPAAGCAAQVVITPACGLAGASPRQARDTLRWCREAARILPEMMEQLT